MKAKQYLRMLLVWLPLEIHGACCSTATPLYDSGQVNSLQNSTSESLPEAPQLHTAGLTFESPMVATPLRSTSISIHRAGITLRNGLYEATPNSAQTTDPFQDREFRPIFVLQVPRLTDAQGSNYVPMDSWVYAALERLAAMGFIPSQGISIRPWTRKECIRQIAEAEDIFISSSDKRLLRAEAARLLGDLQYEFTSSSERDGVAVESVYTRYGTIAGPALADGMHFGQTWRNDYGRPLGRGGSTIAGFSAKATYGRLFFYDRQELQQVPRQTGITSVESKLFRQLDEDPLYVNVPGFGAASPATPSHARQRVLELYAGVAFSGNALSFGKQSLFWGPTTMGPFSFSNNAEPTFNLRFVATRPHYIPLLPGLGTYRFDIVFGKLSGHKYPERPYYNGQKVEFNFGKNLDLSFTRWSILWGVGHPMTLGSLRSNIFSKVSTGLEYGYGNRLDPGDRKSGFDFRLHVPGLERFVTIYADSYADDELSPLAAPRRVAWNPGFYIASVPWLPHADFGLEMSSSEELSKDEGGVRFFINNQYLDGNTNNGVLLGNAIGRDARAFEGRAGYWLSSRSRAELGHMQTKISTKFLPGGGTISDAFVSGSYALTSEWTAKLLLQHEQFLIPSYVEKQRSNESGWLQITWNPQVQIGR